MTPFLSIIIPAHNEERRILSTLTRIEQYLKGQNYPWQAIVVDDGSCDQTPDVVRAFSSDHPQVTIISNPHRGKGYAVKTGMLAAQGQFRFICDADLAMPIEELSRFLPPQLTKFDVAIGSREAKGAHRFHEPPYRHIMGRGFNLLVQLLAVPGLSDTQCGFKCFRDEVAQALFPRQRINGFAFDVEILFLARRYHFQIVEVPIDWFHNLESKVRPVRDAFNMLRDIIAVRWNWQRGKYR